MLVVKGLAVCLLTTTLPVRFQVFLLSKQPAASPHVGCLCGVHRAALVGRTMR
ncbi:hypothetical protein Jden_0058 [Jonesia denitrificans DSM 20603]|uniref:Uncharacterized protein n=1 Tax=Jonesia denitrificans (strain ATCC 14870 / DSM 20603 / BCRC 15368 / CIP 55.134 / JCM 11481 / NBRC 15587 / NCTC 10816 / Prevot 55134) TaxID=471856 RepID=C7R556_JONDD|nr:hypothetical protein Jden_0058 [Jonesia denitrificans DSM 20603]SQH19706.1 Uncharacterised protein [Jonesia denitrificans]